MIRCLALVLFILATPAAASNWPETPTLEGVTLATYVGVEVRAPAVPKGTPDYDGQLQANLLQALIAANPFDVSEDWVQANVDSLMGVLTEQDPGLPERLTDAQKADLRIRAEFAAKSAIVLAAVARAEGIVATEADLEARFVKIAAEQKQPVTAIKAVFANDVDELRNVLVEEKTLDWLLERAVVKAP